MAVEVKICGLTRAEDAAAAAAAGAAYLGVVLAAGSSRRVAPETAREVVAAAGTVPVLGVFGGQRVTEILQLCRTIGLTGAQLHAPQGGGVARQIREQGLIVWRVIRLASENDLASVASLREFSSAVLVEAQDPHVLGGSGAPLPLYLARQARAQLPGHRMVLAGGLTPETVGEAILQIQPDIVDVSSGVELRPGIKDPERIMRFMEAAVGHHSSR